MNCDLHWYTRNFQKAIHIGVSVVEIPEVSRNTITGELNNKRLSRGEVIEIARIIMRESELLKNNKSQPIIMHWLSNQFIYLFIKWWIQAVRSLNAASYIKSHHIEKRTAKLCSYCSMDIYEHNSFPCTDQDTPQLLANLMVELMNLHWTVNNFKKSRLQTLFMARAIFLFPFFSFLLCKTDSRNVS